MLRVSEGAEMIASELHEDIIKRVIERIMIRLARGDDYRLTAVDKWNIQVLQDAGYLLEDIQREIAKKTRLQQQEIKEAFEDAGIRAIAFDDAIYRKAGLDPSPIRGTPYFQRLMQRGYEATLGEWDNFTRTTAEAAQRLFIRSCDKAYNLVASGSISYTQAVSEAIKEAVTDGVMVEYPTGHRDTLETATLRCVRTGVAQATANVQLERMKEMKHDLVITSSHLGARPDHELWQGKIFHVDWVTLDIYKYIDLTDKNTLPPVPQTVHPEYPDFVTSTRYGFVDGLCGANCRHSFSPYFPGMEKFIEQYSTEKNAEAYELQQRQRELERRIRDTKQTLVGLKTAIDNDPNNADIERQYQRKAALLSKQNKEYNDFCEANNLKRLADRLAIAKWDRQQAAQARGAAQKWENRTA